MNQRYGGIPLLLESQHAQGDLLQAAQLAGGDRTIESGCEVG